MSFAAVAHVDLLSRVRQRVRRRDVLLLKLATSEAGTPAWQRWYDRYQECEKELSGIREALSRGMREELK